jgi:hypothetical protein
MREKGIALRTCISHFSSQNNNQADFLLPALDLLVNYKTINESLFPTWEGNISILAYCANDAYLFNAGLYKYKGTINQKSYGKAAYLVLHTAKILKTCKKTVTQPIVGCYEYVRSQGKIFSDATSIESTIDQTSDDRIQYWKTVLMPTIFPETYQVAPEGEKEWSVKELKEQTIMLLLCLREQQTNTGLKIPKVLLNHHIFPAMFNQAFDAINNHFCTVEKDMLSQITTIKELATYKIDITQDQREFFENFHIWYPEQANAVLSKRFAIVQQLIEFHNKQTIKK